jgi:hypothetical protein
MLTTNLNNFRLLNDPIEVENASCCSAVGAAAFSTFEALGSTRPSSAEIGAGRVARRKRVRRRQGHDMVTAVKVQALLGDDDTPTRPGRRRTGAAGCRCYWPPIACGGPPSRNTNGDVMFRFGAQPVAMRERIAAGSLTPDQRAGFAGA